MRRIAIAGLVLFSVAGSACSVTSGSTAELARTSLSVPGSDVSASGVPGSSASAGSASTPAPVAPGSVTMADPADGFSLTLPAGFQRVTDPKRLQQLVTGAKTLLPAGQAQAAQAALQYIKIYAIRRNRISDFASTVNAIVHDLGTPEDPTQIAAIYPQASQEIVGIGGTVTGHRPVTVAGRPALELSYTIKIAGVNVLGTQVYLIRGTEIFVLTVSDDKDYPTAGLVPAVLAGVRFS